MVTPIDIALANKIAKMMEDQNKVLEKMGLASLRWRKVSSRSP